MHLQDLSDVESNQADNAGAIVAVVVTYNRLSLLQRLIRALRRQSLELQKIIVVNNGSTDGTRAWLAGEDLICISQDNLGSAGGVATGLEAALAVWAKFIWVMDDDGVPSEDCLEKLMVGRRKSGIDVVCPLVVDETNRDRLAFGLNGCRTVADIISVSQGSSEPIFRDVMNPFNGLLLPSYAVHSSGVPLRGLFIWGDELEYEMRLKKSGLTCGTVTNALFFHPPNRIKTYTVSIAGHKLSAALVEQKPRLYLYVRNIVYMRRRHWLLFPLVRFVFGQLLIGFLTLQVSRLIIVSFAAVDGLFFMPNGYPAVSRWLEKPKLT